MKPIENNDETEVLDVSMFNKEPDPETSPTTRLPDNLQYPDEIEFSAEQERAIREAIREPGTATGLTGKLPDTVDGSGAEPDFSHLAPPKKSAAKIILRVFFILVIVGAIGFGAWYFWWTQYATFPYTLRSVVILDGQEISANAFLPESETARGVTAEFKNPEFTPVSGPAIVPLNLSLGLRSLEADATLYVLTPLAQITHEFRDEAPDLVPADLLKNPEIARNAEYEIAFVQPPLPLADYEVGGYTLNATLGGVPFSVDLIVADTTVPIATPQDVSVLIGEEITADMFVTDIFDHSEILSVEFIGTHAGEDVFGAFQNQIIEVDITDAHGNTNTYAASLTVQRNMIAPTLVNVPTTIESMIDTALTYPENTVALDDFGREMLITYDDTGINTNEVGEYSVTYIAEDFSGLRTEVEVPVFITEIDPEEVDRWVDEKLDEILTTGMSQEEIVRAIFEEVRKTITASTSLEFEWTGSRYTAAHYAINNPTGNHYHYYALSDIMLTRAGIPNMRIERSETSKMDTPHFWNLVLINDEWYHYDSTYITNWNAYSWMNDIMHAFTQNQADKIAEQLVDFPNIRQEGYYDYNAADYPDIKTDPEEES